MANFSQIEMSHLSTQYVFVPFNVTKLGVSYNPTGDAVAFAFMPTPYQVPVAADWVAGGWDSIPSNILYPFSAKCLVGPAGAITLGIGTYIVYTRVTDNPEIPIQISGQLSIS